MASRKRTLITRALIVTTYLLLCGCRFSQSKVPPSIEFTKLPEAVEGGPDKFAIIEGHVDGAKPGQQLVLFARSGVWWVQPLANQPFTTIHPDSKWSTPTHLGTEYAALLVEPGYKPPAKVDVLPAEGNGVIAIATAKGNSPVDSSKTLNFSGYEWEIRQIPSSRGGTVNTYDPANAWTDANGFLHLRIAQDTGKWTCAEVRLTHSLGYGSYRFVVHDSAQLEPAAVLGMFTWDDRGEDQNHREIDIEISRWGDVASQNAQYLIQPYYVPANVARFSSPPGVVTHSFRWEPGQLHFKTVRGSGIDNKSSVVAEHLFKSGIPTPGSESIHLNLYVFQNTRSPMQNGSEVIIEKFEYLP